MTYQVAVTHALKVIWEDQTNSSKAANVESLLNVIEEQGSPQAPAFLADIISSLDSNDTTGQQTAQAEPMIQNSLKEKETATQNGSGESGENDD